MPRSPNSLLKASLFLLLVLSAAQAEARGGGFHGGGFHMGGLHGSGRARGGHSHGVIYELLQIADVSDKTALDKAMTEVATSIAEGRGSVVVDADTENIVGSSKLPAHTTIVVFDDLRTAQLWRASASFKEMSAGLQKAGEVTLREVGGITPSIGRHPLPGDDPRSTTFSGPRADSYGSTIKDICKGC